jgi:hypothetical protein
MGAMHKAVTEARSNGPAGWTPRTVAQKPYTSYGVPGRTNSVHITKPEGKGLWTLMDTVNRPFGH